MQLKAWLLYLCICCQLGIQSTCGNLLESTYLAGKYSVVETMNRQYSMGSRYQQDK